ncbi:ATP-binding protein [Vibrio splendidus]|uniref:ATP-binding protein n=1 Tax=Vibrio splendidus TaxID=29497 RepID=UPI000066FCD8|nr:ATP-binding protein [Vibrio splendidus]EAP95686.1 sensor histidine kinase [Vibrio splendidus 12B01]OCH63246.1 two-component sensor histidine kinase [Vibrio splendidus]
MRRIYLESFIGLIVWFIVSIFSYEYVVYQLNTDYDYVLQEREGEAFQKILLSIHHNQGQKSTLDTLERFVEKTSNKLAVFQSDDVPEEVAVHFNNNNSNRQVFFDENRFFWFKLREPDVVYLIVPDFESELRRAIEFGDNIAWVFILAGFLVYSICFIWFLGRRVRLLEEATIKFAKGDFNVRASIQRGKALGSLNRSFNYMADKISNLITGNRFLTNAVAHDLRTPIFRIQWQAEMLQDQEMSQEQHDKIASIIEDTEEMERLVDEQLCFAKMERAESELNIECLNLKSFLTEIVERLPNSCGVNIILYMDNDIEFSADRSLLKRGVVNLLSNAVKYARSEVQLKVKHFEERLILQIEDDGQGIASEHWPSIFKPFYSADASRNKESSGFGLGLAIVDLIAKRHHGSVEVGQSLLGGAMFTLTFPKLSG